MRGRHFWLMLFFVLWVAAPTIGVGLYLYGVASDQYASYVGFAVRKEETNSAVEILGGITELTSSTSSDTDILYKFIKGREMIREIDAQLDLASIYQMPGDPVFGLAPGASQEEKDAYWQRVVRVFYDRSSGLIELRVTAFDPADAQRVAQAIVTQSTRMINNLSAIARDDATRYTREELDRAVERLKRARQAINTFRARTQIIDPMADTEGQMSILASLQSQLATTMIELDLLRQSARDSDPRIAQKERRVQVIRDRIAEERKRFGAGTIEGGQSYSELIGEYEVLAVDLEFSEKSYLAALAAHDAALAKAQRQSRYLAVYLPPSLAEDAEYPQRGLLLLLWATGLFLSWAIAMLIYYSIRDRR